MAEAFLNGRVILHCGNCLDVLATLPECSVDSVVTDPPYHLTSIVKRFGSPTAKPVRVGDITATNDLKAAHARSAAGFMGKQWDGGDIAFKPETWAEVLRVLKPGGHLLAFGGTRTFARMSVAIEDAGFEVRDTLAWVFGTGFPKNHSVSRNPMFCQCGETAHNDGGKDQEHTPSDRSGTGDDAFGDGPRSTGAPHSSDIRQDCQADYPPDYGSDDGRLRPCEDGDQVSFPSPQYAQGHTHSFERDGDRGFAVECSPSRAQHNDRPSNLDCSGRETVGTSTEGRRPTSKSRADISGLGTDKRGSGQGLSSPVYGNGFPRCQVCGKPNADGFGSALKPAMELVVMARKPLSEPTIAANCARWGTGAINVGACRVPSGTEHMRGAVRGSANGVLADMRGQKDFVATDSPLGRWPANLIHDGSEEVVGAFPDTMSGTLTPEMDVKVSSGWSGGSYANRVKNSFEANTGSAARFFYSAKADGDDRLGSRHPTVKPVDLMQYLVRLVTPPGGVVLDPFAGTGTTGEAAWREGMRAILIEAETEYQADGRRRMELALAGPDEKAHAIIKAKGLTESPGPLFDAIEYNAHKDVEGSFEAAYAAIRERVAAGGPGWTPRCDQTDDLFGDKGGG